MYSSQCWSHVTILLVFLIVPGDESINHVLENNPATPVRVHLPGMPPEWHWPPPPLVSAPGCRGGGPRSPVRQHFLKLVCVQNQDEATPILRTIIRTLTLVHKQTQQILAEKDMLELP